MNELVLPAPAKLNLFLHINGQKENGYHELQSIFQFIDHCDTLTFAPRNDQRIQINSKIPNIYEKNSLIYHFLNLITIYFIFSDFLCWSILKEKETGQLHNDKLGK